MEDPHEAQFVTSAYADYTFRTDLIEVGIWSEDLDLTLDEYEQKFVTGAYFINPVRTVQSRPYSFVVPNSGSVVALPFIIPTIESVTEVVLSGFADRFAGTSFTRPEGPVTITRHVLEKSSSGSNNGLIIDEGRNQIQTAASGERYLRSDSTGIAIGSTIVIRTS